VTGIADDVCDRLVDYVDEVAFPFPAAVIGEPLEVDRADRAAVEIRRYLGELAAARRARPAEDLISELVVNQDGDHQLDEDELVTMAALILGAGFETTTGLLADGFAALIENPAAAQRLRAHPKLATLAAAELLRFDTPVQFVYGRTAVEVTVVGNIEVNAGQRLITILGAGNRDPRQFTDPDRLRVDGDDGPSCHSAAASTTAWAPRLPSSKLRCSCPRCCGACRTHSFAGVPVRGGGSVLGTRRRARCRHAEPDARQLVRARRCHLTT
jgi:cytochrome P450